MPRPVDFTLYLITDRHQVPDGDLPRAVAQALAGGVRAVQLREKDLAGEDLRRLAVELRELTRRVGARLLINSDLALAREVGADGVHLTSDSPDIIGARCRLGEEQLIGVSTHSLDELIAAQSAGADFVTFGPVFATPSKLAYGTPVGVPELNRVCSRATCPVFALGGVDLSNLPQVKAAGAAGLACIRPVLAAEAPARAAGDLLSAWGSPPLQRTRTPMP